MCILMTDSRYYTAELNTTLESNYPGIKNKFFLKLRKKKKTEEKIGKTLFDINHSKILLDPCPRVMKTKVNKWDLIKLKSFCPTKETTKKKR